MREMGTCERFFESDENDLDMQQHLSRCRDCLAYKRIARAIRLMYESKVPDPEWEAKIMDRIDARESTDRESGDRKTVFLPPRSKTGS
jgi:hypothetical protein